MRSKIQNPSFERRNFQKVLKNLFINNVLVFCTYLSDSFFWNFIYSSKKVSYGIFVVEAVPYFYIFFKDSSIAYLNNYFKVKFGEKMRNKFYYFGFCICLEIIINFNIPLMKIAIPASLRFIISENSTKIC